MIWKILRVIAIILSVMTIGLVAIGHVGVILRGGYSAYIEMMNPLNIGNTIITLLTIMPPILLYQYANKKIKEVK